MALIVSLLLGCTVVKPLDIRNHVGIRRGVEKMKEQLTKLFLQGTCMIGI